MRFDATPDAPLAEVSQGAHCCHSVASATVRRTNAQLIAVPMVAAERCSPPRTIPGVVKQDFTGSDWVQQTLALRERSQAASGPT